MTWHSFFDLSTMHERHLVAAYAVAILLQGGYLARIAWSWTHPKPKTP